MRITDKIRFSTAMEGLSGPRDRLGELQQQISTGRNILRPQDNPARAARILNLQEYIGSIEQYERNIDRGDVLLKATESALANAENTVIRARELAVQMSNDTYSARDRAGAGAELQGQRALLLDLANARIGDTYLFAGYVTNSSPFDAAGAYGGDAGVLEVEVGDGILLPVTTRGDQAFGPTNAAGVSSAFEVLDDLILALGNNDGDAIRASLAELDGIHDALLNARTDVGTKMLRVDSTADILDRVKLDFKRQLGDQEDADFVAIASQFQLEEMALEAAVRMTAKLSQPSLLDFIR